MAALSRLYARLHRYVSQPQSFALGNPLGRGREAKV
jgi:hypothetical protein